MFSFNKFFPLEVVAFTSDRKVDFTLSKKVLSPEQEKYLKTKLGFRCQKIFNIKQVHGANVVAPSDGRDIVEADGATTNAPDVALAVRTADCLPIFMYDPVNKAIGLVHAGWRGSQKTIVVHALRTMNKKWGSQTADLKVAFGPCIRSCCYQVGDEFKRYFPKETSRKEGRTYLDLVKVNRNYLISMNVKESNITDCGICTVDEESCFSYRREGGRAGRMISIMMLRRSD